MRSADGAGILITARVKTVKRTDQTCRIYVLEDVTTEWKLLW